MYWKKVKPAARCSHTVAVMRACRQQLYLWCTAAAMPCDAHARGGRTAINVYICELPTRIKHLH